MSEQIRTRLDVVNSGAGGNGLPHFISDYGLKTVFLESPASPTLTQTVQVFVQNETGTPLVAVSPVFAAGSPNITFTFETEARYLVIQTSTGPGNVQAWLLAAPRIFDRLR